MKRPPLALLTLGAGPGVGVFASQTRVPTAQAIPDRVISLAPTLVGVTSTSRGGDEGLATMNADCNSTYSRSRICTDVDFLSTAPGAVPGDAAWLVPPIVGVERQYHLSVHGMKMSHGGHAEYGPNCTWAPRGLGIFGSATDQDALYETADGNSAATDCTDSLGVACCRITQLRGSSLTLAGRRRSAWPMLSSVNGPLHVYDGTALVIRPWFGGWPEPWAMARDTVQRRQRDADHLAVVIDRTMDTFRRELDPAYKAHRPPAPPDLIAHFDRFEAQVAALGVPVFGSLTYEADDLAATLVRLARAEGLDVVLHSDDKDLFQLVAEDPDVIVSDDPRGRVYDRAGVVEKLGVQPEQIVDYLALVGDSSDGVPGVPGVGAKTAARLLAALQSLDGIYADLPRVATLGFRGARTLPDKLAAGHEAALHARRLVRLVDDVDLGDDALARCRVVRR